MVILAKRNLAPVDNNIYKNAVTDFDPRSIQIGQVYNILSESVRTDDLIEHALSIFSGIRDSSSLLISFDKDEMDLNIEATSGLFNKKKVQLSGEWASTMVSKVLGPDRCSIHLPNIHGDHAQVVIKDKVETVAVNNYWIHMILPNCLKRSGGAVLLTPLNLIGPGTFSQGLIFEYKRTPFSPSLIMNARTLSPLFLVSQIFSIKQK